jgi:predicted transcriptional regulator
MKSELLGILEIVDFVKAGPCKAESICQRFGISVATLKRRLDEARHLGAHVESVKVGREWVYHLANADSVSARLSRWLDLERSRSLV